MSADPLTLLRTAYPEGLPTSEYERAVAMVLESVGHTHRPKHRRIGAVISGLLQEYGELEQEALARMAGCSVGSVYNGLRACGALHRKEARPSGGKARVLYRLPAPQQE